MDINKYVKRIILLIVEFIKVNSDLIKKFLTSNNIIKISIGMLLGTQISLFVNSLINTTIIPLLNSLNIINKTQFENINYNILGVQIKIGQLLISSFTLLLTIIIVYVIWRIMDSFTNSVLLESLNNVEKYITVYM
jgi:large-conductance mechanosensitive channel